MKKIITTIIVFVILADSLTMPCYGGPTNLRALSTAQSEVSADFAVKASSSGSRKAPLELPISKTKAREIFRASGWKKGKVIARLRSYGIRKSNEESVIEFFSRVGILEVFKDEFVRVHLTNGCCLGETAKHFGVDERQIGGWVSEMRVKSGLEKALKKKQSELTEKKVERIFISSKFKIGDVAKWLMPYGAMTSSGPVNAVAFLISIRKTVYLKNKIIGLLIKNKFSYEKVADRFGVKPITIRQWIKILRLEKRLERELKKKQSELTEKRIEQIFISSGFKIKDVTKKLKAYGWKGRNASVIAFLIRINKTIYIKKMLKELFVDKNMSYRQAGGVFGVTPLTVKCWVTALDLEGEIETGLEKVRKLEEKTEQELKRKQSGLSEKEIEQIFVSSGFKIKGVARRLRPYGFRGNKKGWGVISFLISIDKTAYIKKKLKELFIDKNMSYGQAGRIFGVSYPTVEKWLTALGLKDEIEAELEEAIELEESLERELEKKQSELTEEKIEQIFVSSGFKIKELAKKLMPYGYMAGVGPVDVVTFLISIGRTAYLERMFIELLLENNRSYKKTAGILSVTPDTLIDWIKVLGLKKTLEEEALKKKHSELTEDMIEQIFISSGFKIKKVARKLKKYGCSASERGRGVMSFLISIDKTAYIKKKLKGLFLVDEKTKTEIAGIFGISIGTIDNWIKALGLADEIKAHLKGKRAGKKVSPKEKALKELVDSSAIEDMAEAFGSPERVFGLLSAMHGGRLGSKDLALAVEAMYDDADKGDIERRQERASTGLSFKKIRNIQWPDTFGLDELSVLTAEIIKLSYPNLVRDPNFLRVLKKQANSKKNQELPRQAYQKALEYYQALIEMIEKDDPAGVLDKNEIILRLFQFAGIKFILDKKRAILADEAGMGKTIQAIVAALKSGAEKILIVCPSGAKKHWYDEIMTKTLMKNETTVISGEGKKLPGELEKAVDSKFVIVHYEALRQRAVIEGLKTFGFDFIIVDEAHEIRNETLHTRALRELDTEHKAEYKLLVTATPLIGRSPAKIYNLLNWLYPERYKSRMGFSRTFDSSFGKLMDLNNELSNFMIRRYKQDVLCDLPPIEHIDVEVELKGLQERVYDRLWGDFKVWMDEYAREGKRPAKPIVLSKILRAREAVIDASIVEDIECESAKLAALDKLVKHHLERKEKIVIFSNFKDVVKKIAKIYAKYNALAIYGRKTSKNDKAQALFQQDNFDYPILVTTLKSGAYSKNFCKGNITIFTDEDWVPENMDSASEREHRFGQDKAVTVYHIIAKGTVDEHVRKVLNEARRTSYIGIDRLSNPKIDAMFIDRLMEEVKDSEKLREWLSRKKEAIQHIQQLRQKKAVFNLKDDKNEFEISLDDKANWFGSLKDKDDNPITFKSLSQLLDKRELLSQESKSFIKFFVSMRLKSEKEHDIPLKQSVLWQIFLEAMPQLKSLDFHPRLIQFDMARDITQRLIKEPHLKSKTLHKRLGLKNSELDFAKSIYLLDRFNIFEVLSALKILPQDYYYNGNALDYTHPALAIEGNGGLYYDDNILKAIHPEGFSNGNGERLLSGLSDKAMIMNLRGSSRTPGMAADIRLCREIKKGNLNAPDIFVESHYDITAHAAFSVGTNFERLTAKRSMAERVVPQIDYMDLFNEANLILMQLIPRYPKVGKTIPAEEFFFKRIRRKVDSYFWKKISQSEPGIHSMFKARYKKGAHKRDGEKVTTWLDTFAAQQESPPSVTISSELIDIAWGFLDELIPYKRDLIMQSILGATAAELSDDFGMDIRTVKKELASIEVELREKARKREQAFRDRLRKQTQASDDTHAPEEALAKTSSAGHESARTIKALIVIDTAA